MDTELFSKTREYFSQYTEYESIPVYRHGWSNDYLKQVLSMILYHIYSSESVVEGPSENGESYYDEKITSLHGKRYPISRTFICDDKVIYCKSPENAGVLFYLERLLDKGLENELYQDLQYNFPVRTQNTFCECCVAETTCDAVGLSIVMSRLARPYINSYYYYDEWHPDSKIEKYEFMREIPAIEISSKDLKIRHYKTLLERIIKNIDRFVISPEDLEKITTQPRSVEHGHIIKSITVRDLVPVS